MKYALMSRLKVSNLLLLISVFLSLPVAHAESTLEKIRRTGKITIAHREASIPFSYYDSDKKPVGYAVELCQRIAEAVRKELGLKTIEVQYLMVTGATRIDAIVNGQADLECGSTTNNKERREKVAFTIPHYIAGMRLLVRSADGIKSIEDLRGRTIVSTQGTTSIKLLRVKENEMALRFKSFLEGKDHAESFAMVERKEADAFAMDDILLYSLRAASKNPSATAVVGQFLSIEPLAIMLRKDDPAFKKVVDREMARTITSFEINALYKKWFQEPIPPKGINLNVPMNFLLRDSFRFPTDKVSD